MVWIWASPQLQSAPLIFHVSCKNAVLVSVKSLGVVRLQPSMIPLIPFAWRPLRRSFSCSGTVSYLTGSVSMGLAGLYMTSYSGRTGRLNSLRVSSRAGTNHLSLAHSFSVGYRRIL